MRKVRAQRVDSFWTTCGKVANLCTAPIFLLSAVYNSKDFSATFTAVLPWLSHSNFRLFPSVTTVFLPTIHTTYKDNQKLINLFSY
jgi:hypothetical protein